VIVDYYRGRRLGRSDAEAFGISVAAPEGSMAVGPGRGAGAFSVSVGRVVLTRGDGVRVVPREGVEPRAMELLLGAAEQVWRFGRASEQGWRRHGGGGWETDVEVRLDC